MHNNDRANVGAAPSFPAPFPGCGHLEKALGRLRERWAAHCTISRSQKSPDVPGSDGRGAHRPETRHPQVLRPRASNSTHRMFGMGSQATSPGEPSASDFGTATGSGSDE